MKNLFLALLMILALVLPGCAANTIRPFDGVTIETEADIDQQAASIEVNSFEVLCKGESFLPFPTGKLGAFCGAVRGGAPSGAVGEGTVLEEGTSVGEGAPVSFNEPTTLKHAHFTDVESVALNFEPYFRSPFIRAVKQGLTLSFDENGLRIPFLDPLYMRPGGSGGVFVYDFA